MEISKGPRGVTWDSWDREELLALQVWIFLSSEKHATLPVLQANIGKNRWWFKLRDGKKKVEKLEFFIIYNERLWSMSLSTGLSEWVWRQWAPSEGDRRDDYFAENLKIWKSFLKLETQFDPTWLLLIHHDCIWGHNIPAWWVESRGGEPSPDKLPAPAVGGSWYHHFITSSHHEGSAFRFG